MITLYSTGCPQCKVLEAKLAAKGIKYELNNDVDYMIAQGWVSVPILLVDGEPLTFGAAMKWVNNYGN